jgi:6,7-dimethyl-8-ribityllumazine synthase
MADIRTIEGADTPDERTRFGIIASRFNNEVVDLLVDGCVATLKARGVSDRHITLVTVPGAFEIAFAARRMAMSGDYDALIALGAVIRGETPHFDFVAAECARGIAEVSADLDIPVAFGVLTTDTDEQAAARAGGSMGNKGSDAALVAIEMVNLARELSK